MREAREGHRELEVLPDVARIDICGTLRYLDNLVHWQSAVVT